MESSAVEFLNLCALGRFVVYSIFTKVRPSQKSNSSQALRWIMYVLFSGMFGYSTSAKPVSRVNLCTLRVKRGAAR